MMEEFVYPYNFVTIYGDEHNLGRRKKRFKPLHRYDGLTGRIEYTMTTLSPLFIPDPEGTSLYRLSDNPEDTHRVMDFFNVEGRLCLPPASVKGMVRNVIEAATNSRFGVFDSTEERETFRKTQAFRNLPGIYNNGQIIPCGMAKIPLQLLKEAIAPCAGKPAASVNRSDIRRFRGNLLEVSVWKIHTGYPVVVSLSFPRNPAAVPQSLAVPDIASLPSVNGRVIAREGGKIGIEAITTNEIYPCPGDIGLSVGDNVSFKAADFPSINHGNNRVVWYRNGNRVWSADQVAGIMARLWLQRFYYDEEVYQSGVKMSDMYVFALYPLGSTPLGVSDAIRKAYADANRDDKHFPTLKDRQAVFYRIGNNGNVVEIGPAAMFKTVEEKCLNDIIAATSPHVNIPEKPESLSPATRLFGWTPDGASGEQGIMGRVRFGVPWGNRTLDNTTLIPLKVLGSPRRKYYPFYLEPIADAERRRNKAAYYTDTRSHPWSRTPGRIRGRKFYLHHPALLSNNGHDLEYLRFDHEFEKEIPRWLYERCSRINNFDTECMKPQVVQENNRIKYVLRYKGIMSPEERDRLSRLLPNGEYQMAVQGLFKDADYVNQNATCAVLPGGAEFTGTIDFESLDQEELGMILWALTVSDDPFKSSADHAHKLGMGKGIGMGSVTFKIKKIVLEDHEEGWLDIERSTDREFRETNETFKACIREFKLAVVRGRDGDRTDDRSPDDEFREVPFIRDLMLILQRNLVGRSPVQYHPPGLAPNKGFEYFMEQRQKRVYREGGIEKYNDEQTLVTPGDLSVGRRQAG